MPGKNFLDTLIHARENCGGYALCADLSGDGRGEFTSPVLKTHAVQAGLKLFLYIGGCESLRDIRDAQIIGADGIVAPMIESVYALEKLSEAVESVYGRESVDLILSINTYDSAKKFEDLLAAPAADRISLVIADRLDIASSSGKYIGCDDREMTELISAMSQICRKKGKNFVVRGGISEQSIVVFPEICDDMQIAVCAGNVLFECGSFISHKEKMRDILYAGILSEAHWHELESAAAERTRRAAEKRHELFTLKYAKTIEKAHNSSGVYS